MSSGDLSAKERAILFALLGEAREVSNPELAERWGFTLTGKERRVLNGLRLVDSRRSGRTYAHELSDAGWRWCAVELAAGPDGPRGNPASMERALYAVLSGLARYLDDTGQNLAEVFRRRSASEPELAKPDDIEAAVMGAYRVLATEPGEFVKLRELRERLPAILRADLDSALERMYRARQVNLVPQANQQALTDADLESALWVGDEFKHLLSVR
jgi:DNA-binding Lrp family transcriptional regulator